MRANLNQIERIDQYLRGELSSVDHQLFEQELQHNPDLKENLENHKLIQQAALRLSIKSLCENIAVENQYLPKKSFLPKNLGWYFSIVVTLATFWWGMRLTNGNAEFDREQLAHLIDSLDQKQSTYWIDTSYLSEAELKDTPCFLDPPLPLNEESFTIDNSQNNVLQGSQGTVVFVPSDAFETKEGKAVNSSNIKLGIVEALDLISMIKYGLTTMAGKDVLRSEGMVRINAYQNGEELRLKKGKAFEIQIPTDQVDPNMMAWKGVPQPSGSINWEQPKKIENFLNKVPLKQLDFLPLGFAELVEKGLPYRDYKKANKKNVEAIYFQLKREKVETRPTQFEMTVSENVSSKLPSEIDTPSPFRSYYGTVNFRQPVNHKSVNVYVFDMNNKFVSCVDLNKNNVFYFFSKNKTSQFKIQIVTTCESINVGTVTFDSKNKTTLNISNKSCGPIKNDLPTKSDSSVREGVVRAKPQERICYIDPLKIKALLTPKFANTFIATKEFEERLQYMHDQRNGSTLLSLYLKNLDKALWECDALAEKFALPEAKEQFQKWAELKCTNVRNANKNQAELEAYLNEKRQSFLEERTTLLTQLKEKDLQTLSALQSDIAQIQNERDALKFASFQGVTPTTSVPRTVQSAAKQKAKVKVLKSVPIPPSSYKVSWYQTGWLNIDAYLHDLAKSGEKKVVIRLKGKEIKAKMIQCLPLMNVLIPLNKMKDFFEAKFPRNLKGKDRSTFTFAIAKEGDKTYFAVQEYDALSSDEIELKLEEKSPKEIEDLLKNLVPKTKNSAIIGRLLQKDIERVEKANMYSAELEKMNQEIQKRQKDLDEFTKKRQQESLFINGLIDYIDHCSSKDSSE